MPPKTKLHKNSGKPKAMPQPSPTTSSGETGSGLSPEVARQFEVELCWCIQELQKALRSGKLNEKQSKYFVDLIIYLFHSPNEKFDKCRRLNSI